MARRTGISGLKELNRALEELPKSVGKAAIRRVLKKAGKPIEDAGRANAPIGPTGNLSASYTTSTKLTKRQRALHKKMFKDDRASVEMFVGPNDPAAIQTEFGNEHQIAEPHLRPAWDAEQQTALQIVKDELWGEISSAAKRLARRRAKAAKG